jgi:hypothetical protein
MNEEQIANKVSQNIQTETHIPGPYETGELKPETGESAFDSNVELNLVSPGQQLVDYFEISRIDIYNEHTQRQLRDVYTWAAEKAQSTEMDKILTVIRSLEMELGATYTTDKLQRIAKFIKLQKQAEVLRLQQEALYA